MTSQPGWETIAIHILFNISRSKGNQTMKLRQLIEYNKRKTFLQTLCRKWDRETSSKPVFIFQKAWYEIKASGLELSFNLFQWPLTWHAIRTV